jgi:serine/threonine protein phosphatase 1
MLHLLPAPASLPAGDRIYAIGDIHGAAPALRALHALVAADLEARPVARPLLIHLGDYLDKGPDSAGVLDHLQAGPPAPGLPVILLRGNHERTALAALDGDGAATADWLWGGGRATLESWGLAEGPGWAASVPPAHAAFLRQDFPLTHRAGGYFFAHAGIRPGVPLEAQAEDDLLTIRHAFLWSEADHGAVVVHGHTARQNPEPRANRIGIDTAAWSGGKLTCLVLEGETMGFLQA